MVTRDPPRPSEEASPPAAATASGGLGQFPFADRALTLMLFVMVVDIFLVIPLSELAAGSGHWSHVFLMTVLGLSALAIWGNLWLTDLFVAGCIACVTCRIAYLKWGTEELLYVGYILAAGTLTMLAYLLSRRVFAPGRVNVHRIQGAIALYLLAGMILSQIFQFVSISHPGAFLHLGHPASHADITGSLGYYSFVALTTLGFGDITPVHPLARSFTTLGAVFGTLYPAILIGRLVSAEMLGRPDA
jgi:hypothetical protein